MLDRIDIHVEVPRVDYEKLSSDRLGESSTSLRERVQLKWSFIKAYPPSKQAKNVEIELLGATVSQVYPGLVIGLHESR